MRDMRLDESWTGSNLGPPQRQTGRVISTVTSRQYVKRAIFVSGDVRFQDGDAVDLGKLGRGPLLPLLFLSPMSALAYFAIKYTHRPTLIYRNLLVNHDTSTLIMIFIMIAIHRKCDIFMFIIVKMYCEHNCLVWKEPT